MPLRIEDVIMGDPHGYRNVMQGPAPAESERMNILVQRIGHD